jgi:predicted transposase/invertase (TIGR01784 family)
MTPEAIHLSPHPHDAFAIQMFSDPERAAKLLQAYLPQEIVAEADWSTLTLEPSTYIRHDLQKTQSDLLFSVKFRGLKLRLYLLFEHQSTPDKLMPLRLLAYVVQILQKLAEQDGLPLPPVIGFVLHQGPDEWTVSHSTQGLFDLDERVSSILQPYLPKMEYALLDLT